MPLRLVVVLGGHRRCVQQHQDDDQPVEELGLDQPPRGVAETFLCPPEGRTLAHRAPFLERLGE